MMYCTKKILIISYIIREKTGGGAINQRNIDVIKRLCNNVSVLYIDPLNPKVHVPLWTRLWDRIQGIFSGLSKPYIEEIRQCLISEQPDIVFINQSLLGVLAQITRASLPQATVITFFHNCESHYYASQYRTQWWNPIALLNLLSSRKAESKAARYSHLLAAMNKRDAVHIQRLYHKNIHVLLPTSITDQGTFPYTPSSPQAPLELLFVGYRFFANVHGITWFCKEVMPQVPQARLTIVGRDMENERHRLEAPNVHVIGTVEDLTPYYCSADMVVSPIFIGSGMKTKTAEALMYGRPLLATNEALEGYDIHPENVGALCNTSSEFIESILYYQGHKNELITKSTNARALFLSQYSHTVILQRFAQLLKQIA